MINYLAIMMTVSSIILIRSKTEENLEKKKALLEVSEGSRLPGILEDPIQYSGSDDEPSGKFRKKSVCACI